MFAMANIISLQKLALQDEEDEGKYENRIGLVPRSMYLNLKFKT